MYVGDSKYDLSEVFRNQSDSEVYAAEHKPDNQNSRWKFTGHLYDGSLLIENFKSG